MRNILVVIWVTVLFSMSISINAETDAISLQGDGTLRRIHVPILMYHYVSELPADADAIRVGLTLSPAIFQEHVNYLVNNGYHTISLYEMHLALDYGIPLPSKPVILTFDDGYIDHYVTVFPALQRAGLTGTFFIATDFIDLNRAGHMTWDQVNEMASAGMSIEAHTKTHSDLRARNYDFLVYELLGSMQTIGFHTGTEPRFFAYPVGRYDENTLNVIATTPILRAVTTQLGSYHTNHNAYELPRMRVTNSTGVAGLIQLLNYPQ